MSDYGDFCRDMREHRSKQKEKFRYGGGMDAAIKTATEKASHFEVHNDGEHYVIEYLTVYGLKTVDFWPSTERWKQRKGHAEGIGARRMVKYFKPERLNAY